MTCLQGLLHIRLQLALELSWTTPAFAAPCVRCLPSVSLIHHVPLPCCTYLRRSKPSRCRRKRTVGLQVTLTIVCLLPADALAGCFLVLKIALFFEVRCDIFGLSCFWWQFTFWEAFSRFVMRSDRNNALRLTARSYRDWKVALPTSYWLLTYVRIWRNKVNPTLVTS